MKQEHSPRAINWNNQTRSNKDGASVSPSNTYALPQRILLQRFLNERPKKVLGIRLNQAMTKKAAEDVTSEEAGNFLATEAAV